MHNMLWTLRKKYRFRNGKIYKYPKPEENYPNIGDIVNFSFMNYNKSGIPREPVGFSGDAKIRFGPPKWNDAVFKFNEIDQKVFIYLDKI